jgi:hypothetical protein
LVEFHLIVPRLLNPNSTYINFLIPYYLEYLN